MTSKDKIVQLLAKAEVTLNGPHTFDIQVHDERLYDRIFSSGSLGIGESYMDGWWDVADLQTFLDKVLTARLDLELVR
jgi:cyclopropane-fatty-acyl-phospholipid synthase